MQLRKLIKALNIEKDRMQTIIDNLELLGSDARTNRVARFAIVSELFTLFNNLTNIEIDLYNYFHRRDRKK